MLTRQQMEDILHLLPSHVTTKYGLHSPEDGDNDELTRLLQFNSRAARMLARIAEDKKKSDHGGLEAAMALLELHVELADTNDDIREADAADAAWIREKRAARIALRQSRATARAQASARKARRVNEAATSAGCLAGAATAAGLVYLGVLTSPAAVFIAGGVGTCFLAYGLYKGGLCIYRVCTD